MSLQNFSAPEELVLAINSIGKYEELENGERIYKKDEKCTESLEYISYFISEMDNDTRCILNIFGDGYFIRDNLIPLINTYEDEKDILNSAMKLIMIMTTSDNKEESILIYQKDDMNRKIKEYISNDEFMGYLVTLFLSCLTEDKKLKDEKGLAVFLTLIRNLLLNPPNDHDCISQLDYNIHEKIVNKMLDAKIIDILVSLGEKVDENEYHKYMNILLDIYTLLFTNFDLKLFMDPEFINSKKDSNRKISVPRRLSNGRRDSFSRSARFGGLIVKKDSSTKIEKIIPMTEYTRNSIAIKSPMSRKPISKSIEILKKQEKMTNKFLNGTYRIFILNVFEFIKPGLLLSTMNRDQFCKFFELNIYLMKFFSYNIEILISQLSRHEKKVDEDWFISVGSMCTWDVINFTKSFLQNQVDLKSYKDWRLQALSLSMLKEIISILKIAMEIGCDNDKQASERINRKLLYDNSKDSGIVSILSRLMRSISKKNYKKEFICDAIETIHLVLKMYEILDEKEQGNFIVRKKRRNTSKQDETEMNETRSRYVEVSHDLNNNIRKEFATLTVIKVYTDILKEYWKNNAYTNHCIAKFFQRIADPKCLNRPSILLQDSLIEIYNTILNDPMVKSKYIELYELSNQMLQIYIKNMNNSKDNEVIDLESNDHEIESRVFKKKKTDKTNLNTNQKEKKKLRDIVRAWSSEEDEDGGGGIFGIMGNDDVMAEALDEGLEDKNE